MLTRHRWPYLQLLRITRGGDFYQSGSKYGTQDQELVRKQKGNMLYDVLQR